MGSAGGSCEIWMFPWNLVDAPDGIFGMFLWDFLDVLVGSAEGSCGICWMLLLGSAGRSCGIFWMFPRDLLDVPVGSAGCSHGMFWMFPWDLLDVPVGSGGPHPLLETFPLFLFSSEQS